jgi:hypothetical protein
MPEVRIEIMRDNRRRPPKAAMSADFLFEDAIGRNYKLLPSKKLLCKFDRLPLLLRAQFKKSLLV